MVVPVDVHVSLPLALCKRNPFVGIVMNPRPVVYHQIEIYVHARVKEFLYANHHFFN
jgi:hypothetical protein